MFGVLLEMDVYSSLLFYMTNGMTGTVIPFRFSYKDGYGLKGPLLMEKSNFRLGDLMRISMSSSSKVSEDLNLYMCMDAEGRRFLVTLQENMDEVSEDKRNLIISDSPIGHIGAARVLHAILAS